MKNVTPMKNKMPSDYRFLLQMATGWNEKKFNQVLQRIEKEGKELVPVYPGVPELMKGIDVSEMELIGSIIDGALYLK